MEGQTAAFGRADDGGDGGENPWNGEMIAKMLKMASARAGIADLDVELHTSPPHAKKAQTATADSDGDGDGDGAEEPIDLDADDEGAAAEDGPEVYSCRTR